MRPTIIRLWLSSIFQNRLRESINASQQSVHPTLGILARFQVVSYALSFFWSDGFAVPAPAQVTQTVGPLALNKIERFTGPYLMNTFFDIKKVFPGIEGQFFHVINTDSDALINILEQHHFSIFIIEGTKIIDKATFFDEIAKVFCVPEYFGKGWASWNDYLVEFENIISTRTAIVWKDADKSSAADIHTFLQAVADIYNLAMGVELEWKLHPEKDIEPKQFILFLIGESENFKNRITFG